MSLVLFTNAIEHVSRISRVINQPYGNALLVGVGGSGRKSLTTLAVSIADFKLFSIEISKSYGMADWREDMKAIMILAGKAPSRFPPGFGIRHSGSAPINTA
jgi:dynein heavy chain, axonemal